MMAELGPGSVTCKSCETSRRKLEQAWKEIGPDMMVAANDVSQAVNYNPNAVGKNRPLWRQLHQMAAAYRLEMEAAELREELAAMRAER